MRRRLPAAARLWPAALAAALLAAGPALSKAAAGPGCEGSPDIPYDIDLKIDTPPASVHHDRASAQLGRMGPHGPGGRVLGLASAGVDFHWRVGFEWRAQGDASCFWVRWARLSVRLPSPEIYVAREYPRGSCQYRAILAHEQDHFRASRELINRYLPRLRWVLTSLRIPTGRRPILVESAAAAKAEVRALMQELAEPLFREISEALRKHQAGLDSRASYKRLFAQCDRW